MGSSLSQIDRMPLPNTTLLTKLNNRLLIEELLYDTDVKQEKHDKLFQGLNPDKKTYKMILESILNEEGKSFLVYGQRGTGKSYLW